MRRQPAKVGARVRGPFDVDSRARGEMRRDLRGDKRPKVRMRQGLRGRSSEAEASAKCAEGVTLAYPESDASRRKSCDWEDRMNFKASHGYGKT